MLEINKCIKSDASGKTYTITWASPKVAQAEVGFASTESDGNAYFIKRLLTPVYMIPTEGKPLSPIAKSNNIKCDKHYVEFKRLYDSIVAGCGEDGACVPIIDYFREGRRYYTVYRKINADSLSLSNISLLPEKTKRLLLLRLVQGLQPLHKLGVIHGDLKPDNILVQRDGDELRIRLIDMNDCYRVGKPNEPDAVVGTLEYYSPELKDYNTYSIEDWEDEEEMTKVRTMASKLTTKSDVFALGIIFHEYLTGQKPDITDSTIEDVCDAARTGKLNISADIPLDLRNLISNMLDADYTKRPSLDKIGDTIRRGIIGTNVSDPEITILHLRDNIYKVTISCDSPDAIIYYTINNEKPSSSSIEYTGDLELPRYTQIKAICIKGARKSNIVTKSVWVKTSPLVVSHIPQIIVHGNDITIRLNDKSPIFSKVYYSTDGSIPTSKSKEYSEPFTVGPDVEMVKAMVIESGSNVKPSEVVSAKVYKYKIRSPKISKRLNENSFVIDSEECNLVYFTLDGTAPSVKSNKYIGPFSVDNPKNFCIKAIAIDSEGNESSVSEISSESHAKMKFKVK